MVYRRAGDAVSEAFRLFALACEGLIAASFSALFARSRCEGTLLGEALSWRDVFRTRPRRSGRTPSVFECGKGLSPRRRKAWGLGSAVMITAGGGEMSARGPVRSGGRRTSLAMQLRWRAPPHFSFSRDATQRERRAAGLCVATPFPCSRPVVSRMREAFRPLPSVAFVEKATLRRKRSCALAYWSTMSERVT